MVIYMYFVYVIYEKARNVHCNAVFGHKQLLNKLFIICTVDKKKSMCYNSRVEYISILEFFYIDLEMS